MGKLRFSNFLHFLLIFFIILAPQSWAEEPLDFISAINQIIARNTEIQTQESTWSAIHARNLPTKLFYLPTLNLGGKVPIGNASGAFPIQKEVQLTSQWNLFKWGSDYQGAQAALSEENSQRSILNSTILQAEADAIQALIVEIQRSKEIEINAAIVNTQTELLKVAQERYRSGYLSLQESETLKVDLANAKASLMDSKINEVDARARLENLLGHCNIQFEWPWIEALKNSKNLSLLRQDLNVSERPDWQAAQQRVQFYEHKTSQNWRLLLPSLDASFSYGYYTGYFGSIQGWVSTLALNFPIFDRLSNYSKAKEQSYSRAASESQLEKVQRNARTEWEASRRNFQLALESAFSRHETVNLSRKLFKNNLKRFQAGRISSNELAVDRNRIYQAELFAIQGWNGAHLSLTRLCHSLGQRVADCISKKY